MQLIRHIYIFLKKELLIWLKLNSNKIKNWEIFPPKNDFKFSSFSSLIIRKGLPERIYNYPCKAFTAIKKFIVKTLSGGEEFFLFPVKFSVFWWQPLLHLFPILKCKICMICYGKSLFRIMTFILFMFKWILSDFSSTICVFHLVPLICKIVLYIILNVIFIYKVMYKLLKFTELKI